RPGRDPRPRPAALPRAGRGREATLRRQDPRRGVLRRDRPRVRERGPGRGRRVSGGVRMSEYAVEMRNQLVGLFGIVERNVYLTKRYFLWDIAFMVWTIANTLTIVFIARAALLSPAQEHPLSTTPLVGAAFIGIHAPQANYGAALALLALASISFIGVGIMTSVLPLISPEKGAQLGFVCQGVMLVVSGVYYPVTVMPEWMQWIAKFSPATYAIRGDRNSIIHGTGLVWADVWPLLIIAVLATPIGLAVFRVGERHAKKHGKLKRSG